jgi:hypothetical protein
MDGSSFRALCEAALIKQSARRLKVCQGTTSRARLRQIIQPDKKLGGDNELNLYENR